MKNRLLLVVVITVGFIAGSAFGQNARQKPVSEPANHPAVGLLNPPRYISE